MTNPPRARRILVIEDDPAIRCGVVDALRFAEYEVHEEGDGEAARQSALRLECDLVLLDLVLPRTDGLTILREIRQSRPTLPVVILTARGTEDDRVLGLEFGADDYVVKPFSARELLARVAAVLRRSAERIAPLPTLHIGSTIADLLNRQLTFDDGSCEALTDKECHLLQYLAQCNERPVPREELLEYVWRVNSAVNAESRTVDMTVARLRDKLSRDSTAAEALITVRGCGYLLRHHDRSSE